MYLKFFIFTNVDHPAPHRMTAPPLYNVIVLGAGAAGLMCAIEAGKRGRSVAVLERNAVIGEKIRISGGGRCNFTNRLVNGDEYVSSNPPFCRSALARYTPGDFQALVARHRIPFHEKKLGQLFCDGSSREIITMLERECVSAGVRILTGRTVAEITKSDRFAVSTSAGTLESASLVVATGGLSVPKLGATDLGYRIARQFGLEVIAPRPGLVPLLFAGETDSWFSDMSGVALDAVVSCGGVSFSESVLFTHRGLSGPAILQISSHWNTGDAIILDLAPGIDAEKFLRGRHGSHAAMETVLSEILPRRLAAKWCELHNAVKPIGQCSFRELAALAASLRGWRVVPTGTEGYAKAEVTCGGVDTRGLSSKTMGANRVPGLYFIGEVVDVTGHLGGFNFQWAWASGHAAGQFA